MCGIFAYIGQREDAGQIILDGLKSLEYRGYDSWGIAAKKKNGELFIEKETGKDRKATLARFSSTIGFGHTRWATHGGITKANAHPHTDCTKEVVIVHNGIVDNFAELKEKLSGHTFHSETDTEVIAHLIEEHRKKHTDNLTAVRKTFEQIEGLNALIVFFPKTEEFIAAKNGSPLVFGKTDSEYLFASDPAALLPFCQKVYFLEDKDVLHVTRNHASLYGRDNKEKPLTYFSIPASQKSHPLGNHKHFMIQEIHEQPALLAQLAKTEKAALQRTASLIEKAHQTHFIGCGSSYYAALTAVYFFAQIAKQQASATTGSEFSHFSELLPKNSVLAALSQSGETIDIISNIAKAKEKKAQILAITNGPGSTLYRMSDTQLMMNAGIEKGVLATKSFTSTLALLYLLAHAVAGTDTQGRKKLETASEEVTRLIKKTDQFKSLVNILKDQHHIYVLGRGLSYPAALETALKIKEVSYIHAEGFAAGELKHGVIALIEKGTPVIIFNPEDETYADTLSAAHEVKTRGAFVIGISNKPDPVFDEYIEIKNLGDVTIIPQVVVGQLLGYYLALTLHHDPDKPRNLAKSVTVK